jgi:predicted PurR-regulated permease PerM
MAMNGRPDEHDAPLSKWQTQGPFRGLVVLAMTIAGLYVCYRLIVPFLPALTWALVLTVSFLPVHRWVESKLRSPNLAATVSVILVGLIVVVPALLLGNRLVEEAVRGALTIKAKLEPGEWLRALESNPITAVAAQWISEVDLPEAIEDAASWITDAGAAVIRTSASHIITILLTFYLLFYFLRDRGMALRLLRDMSPLSEMEMRELFDRVIDTVHATIYGTVAVAAVQGILSGLMFWWLALPTPVLWGFVIGLLAVVPVLGAFIVWVPAAIFLALDGSWGKAIILTVWGAVVVGGIDNLLYPVLVGNRLRLHTIPAFISIVGGILLFGPSGLILGPLAVTITIFLVGIWRTRLAALKD